MASTSPSEHAPTTLPAHWPVPGHGEVLLVPSAARHVPSIVAACNDPDVQHLTRVPHPCGTAEAEGYVALAAQEHAVGMRRVGTLRRAGLLGPTGAPGGERSDMVLHDLLPDELT